MFPRRLACSAALIALAACGDDAGIATVVPATSLSLYAPADSFFVGDTTTFTALVRGPAGDLVEDQHVTWSSSNPTALFISEFGSVRALVLSTATIRVQRDSLEQTLVVRVLSRVAKVSFASKTLSVPSGFAMPVTVTLFGAGNDVINGRAIAWTSSDTSVVFAGPGGIRGRRPGTARIIAVSEGHADTATVTVTVRATGLAFGSIGGVRAPGDTVRLSATAVDDYGTTVAFPGFPTIWTSQTPMMGWVDGTGLLHVIGAGTGVVRAQLGPVEGTLTYTSGSVAFVAVEGGQDFGCGLTAAGATFCWSNSNSSTTLGNPAVPVVTGVQTITPTMTVVPGPVRAFGHFGVQGACAITVSNDAWCWGTGVQLGGGSPCTTAPGANCNNGPALVAGGYQWNTVATGGTHRCGVDLGGAARCWGVNTVGQLGDGTTIPHSTAGTVLTPVLFADIGAGYDFSCGLGTDSLAYCWGNNAWGMLGDSSTVSFRATPSPVAGNRHFASLSVGSDHACALTAAGAAWCWGLNVQGQLGRATAELCSNSNPCSRVPVAVAGSWTFAAIRAGNAVTCGRQPDQRLFCFGLLNTSNSASTVTPTLAAGGLKVQGFGVGLFMTSFLGVDGRAYYLFGSQTAPGTLLPGQP